MLARQAEVRPGPFTFEEYMAWEQEQEEKWELVDGYAVRRSERWSFDPATGMAGATYAHNRIMTNLIVALANRLRGGRCEVLPSELKTLSPTGSVRFPDVTVQCGKSAGSDLVSSEPRVLIEVLSKSNTLRQQMKLLTDYQAIATVRQIVFVEQYRPFALVWTRDDSGWALGEIEGLEADLPLPSVHQSLPMSEVYAGLTFDEAA